VTSHELIFDIAGNKHAIISDKLLYWLSTCHLFQEFVNNYRAKVKKKIQNTNNDQDLEDVMFELEVAYLFLLDERFEVMYEVSNRIEHHPDYTIIFQKNTRFNAEVKRIRGVTVRSSSSRPAVIPYTRNEFKKFGDDICFGCRQLVPQEINILVITSDGDNIEDVDLSWAVQEISQMIRAKDDLFFQGKGFEGADDFFKHWQRLSGVVFLSSWMKISGTPHRNELWCNPDATLLIPEPIQEYFRSIRKTRGITFEKR
jgi:hypothetical protein